MIQSVGVEVEVDISSGRVTKLNLGGIDVTPHATRVEILISHKGEASINLEMPITQMSLLGNMDLNLLPTMDMDVISQALTDFLNSINPEVLERQALEAATWGNESTATLMLDALKEAAHGLRS